MTDVRAATIEREHGLVLVAERQAVKHAMACGDVLLSVKAEMSTQAWEAWVSKNTSLSRSVAFRYTRLARYRDVVEDNQPATIHEAIAVLHNEAGSTRATAPDLREQMLKLRDDGLSMPEIAAETGAAVSTVWRWVSPTALPHQRAQRAAQREQRERQAAEAERRAITRAVRLAAGPKSPSSVGYSYLRRAVDAIDAAMRNAEDAQARHELQQAVAALHEAEDALIRALGIQHGARKAIAA